MIQEDTVPQEEIAIIGIACIFPSAPDLGTYWQNILSKVDAITDVPSNRWSTETFYDPDPTEEDRLHCKRGGYLPGAVDFNPLDYGIMPVALNGAEPDQFLLVKLAYEALLDAGNPEQKADPTRTEVILGKGNYLGAGHANLIQKAVVTEQTLGIIQDLHPEFTDDDLRLIKRELQSHLRPFNAETAPSLIPNLTTGRVTNRLDFMGANFTVDAACASSLIATEIGVQDLRTRKHDLCMIGGAHICNDIPFLTLFSSLGAVSPRSEIQPFDENADGTVPGEGIGVIILKRLDDAEKDGDRIYAVIKGVGSSSDGRGLSVTAPRADGEEVALRRAYGSAQVDPQTVGLLEAHGTGAPVGDIAELEALSRVFGEREPDSSAWCALGTVKSMIGHSFPAAGIAGVIKAVLALYHKVLPPTLHTETPREELRAEHTPFYINTETRPWIHGSEDTPRRAGVNAFGFGGINAHVVLEEYQGQDEFDLPRLHTEWDSELLLLHGASRSAVVEKAKQVTALLEHAPDVNLKDLAYTLNVPSDADGLCLAVVASSAKELQRKIDDAVGRLDDPERRQIKDMQGIYYFEEPLQGKLAFMFPGEGAQYLNMLSDLCLHFPEVRDCFDQTDRAFAKQDRGHLPSSIIFPPPSFTEEEQQAASARLWEMDGALEAVLTANWALSRILDELKIEPDMIVGHSSGEFSAMLAAKVAEIDDDYFRNIGILNEHYKRAAAKGEIPEAVMIAAGIAPETAAEIVQEAGGDVYVAMRNCPHQTVIVGEKEAADRVIEQLNTRGVLYEKLPFNRAYHTPLFEETCRRLYAYFEHVPMQAPKTTLYSGWTVAPFPEDPDEIQRTVVEHWMHPVRFVETIQRMYDEGARVFVEVGPRGNLTAFADDILRGKPHIAMPSNLSSRSGITQLHHLVGILAAQGIPMDLTRLYALRTPELLPLEPTSAVLDEPKHPGVLRELRLDFPSMHLADEIREQLILPAKKKNEIASVPPVREATAPSVKPEPAVREEPAPAVSEPARAQTPPPQVQASTPLQAPQMAGSAPVPEAAPQAMQEYLKTMENFLGVQEEVMQMFITGTGGAQQTALTVPSSPMPVQQQPVAPQVQPPIAPVAPTPTPVLTEAPVVPELPVTEPDAGILTSTVEPESEAQPATASVSVEEMTATLLELVSEKTGYPLDMLDVNLDMEADLGIDSIKRTEILGVFQERYGNLTPDDFDASLLEEIAQLKTLQQVIDFLEETATTQGVGDTTTSTQGTAGAPLDTAPYPFIDVVTHFVPGQEMTAIRRVDWKQEDIFLEDHTFGPEISGIDPTLKGIPVIPLTVSIEMLAEAAHLFMQGKELIRIQDVRAHQWIQVEEPVILRMVVEQTSPGMVKAQLWDTDEQGGSAGKTLFLEMQMEFADAFPVAPSPEHDFALADSRSPLRSAEQVYAEHYLFHGPRFHNIVELEQMGSDGLIGYLQVLPIDNLFASDTQPVFMLDPFLFDAVGQLVGYWPLENLDTGFLIFPIRVKDVQLFCHTRPVGERMRCHLRILEMTSTQIRAQIDVIRPDGRLWLRVTGWEDWRFYFPRNLFDFWRFPNKGMVSEHWAAPLAAIAPEVADQLECFKLTGFWELQNTIWETVWAYMITSRSERATYWQLKGNKTDKRRMEWLFGRTAVKDSVRIYAKNHRQMELHPADIEIVQDDNGKPSAHGHWEAEIPDLSVSIAHTGKTAVALAGRSQYLGIDIEQIGNAGAEIEEHAFDSEERALLKACPPEDQAEWLLRLWCSKEAVGKSLGQGLLGHLRNIVVKSFDVETGSVYLKLEGALSEAYPDLADALVLAYTTRADDLVTAISLGEKSPG